MFKYLSLLAFVCFFADVKAQQNKPSDTTIYYRDQMGNPTDKIHVYDVIFIMLADNSTTGKKLYPIKEYYLDGTTELTGMSSTISSKPTLEGTIVTYFPNGQKKSIKNYKKGCLTGAQDFFYPNGKPYSVENYDNGRELLISCRDSTGQILAQNGQGMWLDYDVDFKSVLSEGPVIDGIKHGEWDSMINGKIRVKSILYDGKFVSGTYYDTDGEPYEIASDNKLPGFKHNVAEFVIFMNNHFQYPKEDIENGISGMIVATLFINRDGSLADVKILNSPSATMSAEYMRVIKLFPPSIPGFENGFPVNSEYNVSFEFKIPHK